MKKLTLLFALLLMVSTVATAQKKVSQNAQYKIHSTAQTKTITLDGGVQFMGWFAEGRALIGWRNGWFVIDKQGNKVFSIPDGYAPVPTQSQNGFIGYDSNRLMVYSKSANQAIIYDKTGKKIKELKNVANASGFCGGVALIAKKEKDPKYYGMVTVWYHVDVNGNTLSKTMPISLQGWSDDGYRLFSPVDGLARVWASKEKKWGFRNDKCQWVIKPTFYRLHAFSDGLAAAQKEEDGRWGYIDKTGQWVIQPTFSKEPGNFNCGRARVKDKNDVTHYIDKTGKIVWTDPEPVKCNEYGDFMPSGYALWVYAPREIYLVDTSFRKCLKLPEFFMKISNYGDNYFVLPESPMFKGTKVFDWNGNLIMEYTDSYDGGGDYFSDGVGKIKNYYFNMKGEIIVKFEDTQF